MNDRHPHETATATRSIVALIVILALVAIAASFGARYMPGPWYEALNKPWWTPDKGIFAPVWTLLYLSIAAAAWLAASWWRCRCRWIEWCCSEQCPERLRKCFERRHDCSPECGARESGS